MKRLPMDFAPSRRRRIGATAQGIVLLVLGIVAVVVACWHFSRWYKDYQRLDSRLARQQSSDLAQSHARTKPTVALTGPQVAAINNATRHLNLPWRDIFDAIEAATPPDIALLALDPDTDNQVLRLSAEAATPDAMLDYVDSLKHQPQFGAVTLRRHQIDAQDPNNVLRFSVVLTLRDVVTPMETAP